MSARDDGGAAFPTRPNTQMGHFKQDGMFLRDYMAANAPAIPASFCVRLVDSVVIRGDGTKRVDRDPEPAEIRAARWSYAYADAMLAERSKGDEA